MLIAQKWSNVDRFATPKISVEYMGRETPTFPI